MTSSEHERLQDDNRQGILIEADPGNLIQIDPEAKFERARLIVKGSGSRIVLGKCLLYKNLFINFVGNGKSLIIGDTSKIIANLRIISHRGSNQVISIGSGLSCGGLEVQMNDGDETFTMGNNCLLSWGIKARTSDGHSLIDLETDRAINLPRPVIIGDRVWVCEDVKLMKGTVVRSDCVIAAGSIVTKEFQADSSSSVIGGVPARILRTGIRWDRRMPIEFNNSSSRISCK